jgi:mRNA interferase MazF
MRRGDLVAVADRGGDYTGKPRPAVIVQSDDYPTTESVTICPLSSFDVDATLLRIPLQPDAENGLAVRSFVMIDKITTVRRDRCARTIGRLTGADLEAFVRSLASFLAVPAASRSA